ncbi:hypothetical protein A9Q99_23370 [Gammaproteobacteria bacterium 45_16_T64]|nr:hypothetical protein A9Q99_23370 [Gammaproteobacteria bacterium 45_16_T64]
MDTLPQLHTLVVNTLDDVFSLHDGLHKASLYVLSDDELTEFVRYRDNDAITVIRSDHSDIVTASPWKVLSDVASINASLCVAKCNRVSDPYIQSNDICSFVCAPVCRSEDTHLFLWSDSNLDTVTFSDYDERKINQWAENFESDIRILSQADGGEALEALDVLINSQEPVAVSLSTGDGVLDRKPNLSESAIRIEGLEAVETHLRIYERAVKATNSGVTIIDTRLDDYPIIYCNPAFGNLTGYGFSETVGRNARFLQGEGTCQETLSVIRDAVSRGAHCKVDIKNFKKNGDLFWNELTLSPIIDSDGFLTHYIGIQNDITARVIAEAQLLEARHQEMETPLIMAQAASLAHVIGWQFDVSSGQMTIAGDVFELLNIPRQNIVTPSHFFDTVLPGSIEAAEEGLDAVMLGEEELDKVLPVKGKQGKEMAIHFTAKLFLEGAASDGAGCLTGTIQDVTRFQHM